MHETLRILHLVALMMGGAAGIGSMVLAITIRRQDGAPPPVLFGLRAAFGRIGLVAILLFWLTGLAMWLTIHDGASLGWLYWAKLLAAGLMLALSLHLTMVGARAMRTRTPPPGYVEAAGRAIGALSVVALVLAVLVFG